MPQEDKEDCTNKISACMKEYADKTKSRHHLDVIKWPVSVTVIPLLTRTVEKQMDFAVATIKSTMALGNNAMVYYATVACGCRSNTDLFINAFRLSCEKVNSYGINFKLSKDVENNDVITWENTGRYEFCVTCICNEETKTKTLIGRGLIIKSPTMYTDHKLLQLMEHGTTNDHIIEFCNLPSDDDVSDLHPHEYE